MYDAEKQADTEFFVTLAGLLFVVLFVPLGSPAFIVVTVLVIIASLGYMFYAGRQNPKNWKRWGFFVQDHAEENALYGCQFIGVLYCLSVGIFVIGKLCLPLPTVPYPLAYVLWCVVQDFLFFGIVLQRLEVRCTPLVAVGITAFLFAASHYPLTGFMVITGLAAFGWGYLFTKTRYLPFIILSHATMGICLLS